MSMLQLDIHSQSQTKIKATQPLILLQFLLLKVIYLCVSLVAGE